MRHSSAPLQKWPKMVPAMYKSRSRSRYADLQMFLSFLSVVTFEEIVKQSAWVAKGMTELPTHAVVINPDE